MRHRAPEPDRADCNPDDLLPDLQHNLAALADVEFRYGSALERLEHEPLASGSRFWSRSSTVPAGASALCPAAEQRRERIRARIMPGL
jgi:hypothetical protein